MGGQCADICLQVRAGLRLTRDADGKITAEERLLTKQFGRIRDLAEAPDGALLAVTDDDNGLVIRISRMEELFSAAHVEP